jgi:hypothetical protein
MICCEYPWLFCLFTFHYNLLVKFHLVIWGSLLLPYHFLAFQPLLCWFTSLEVNKRSFFTLGFSSFHLVFYFFCLFIYLALLGFELRALHLLDKHSTAWAMPPPFFCFWLFLGYGLIFLPLLVSDYNTLTYACCVAGIIVVHLHARLVCWSGVLLTFFLGWR